jgi:hypothetical protein
VGSRGVLLWKHAAPTTPGLTLLPRQESLRGRHHRDPLLAWVRHLNCEANLQQQIGLPSIAPWKHPLDELNIYFRYILLRWIKDRSSSVI